MEEKIYNFNRDCGTVYNYIEQAILFANEHPTFKVKCEFNGVVFYITKDSDMDSAIKDYNEGIEKMQEEYRNSEEYKQFLKEQEDKRNKMNSEVKEIIDKFKSVKLPAKTKEEMKIVLDLLCKYQPYSDCTICDAADDSIIIKILRDAGYKESAYVGDKSIVNDMEKFFRYIIGQAIETMRFLALHQMVVTVSEKWFDKFYK